MIDQKNNQEQKLESVNIQTMQEKIVPKFCTNISLALLKNKNIVLTMAYSEDKENTALIERIVIDLEHAKSLNNVLTKLLGNVENGTTKFE